MNEEELPELPRLSELAGTGLCGVRPSLNLNLKLGLTPKPEPDPKA